MHAEFGTVLIRYTHSAVFLNLSVQSALEKRPTKTKNCKYSLKNELIMLESESQGEVGSRII